MWVKCKLSNGLTKILHNMFWKSAIVIYSLLLSDAQKLSDSGLVKRFVAYFLIVQRAWQLKTTEVHYIYIVQRKAASLHLMNSGMSLKEVSLSLLKSTIKRNRH